MVTRRSFSLLATVVGLNALFGPRALPRVLRDFGVSPAQGREPLLDRLRVLFDRLYGGQITPEAFVQDAHACFADTDLPAELSDQLAKAPTDDRTRSVWRTKDGDRVRWVMLFFIPPGHAHPPHAHHNVASAQCVVRGPARVRQYARERRLDPHTLALRPVSDRIFLPQETILTTERLNNVHWFGAETEPAVVINCAVNGGLADTFDPVGTRPTGRYYVDVLTAARVDGLIAAPELKPEEAYGRFQAHALSEFPNSVPAAS